MRNTITALSIIVLMIALALPVFANEDTSGWDVCRLLADTYDLEACIAKAEAYKSSTAPATARERMAWAQAKPKPLSGCTANGVAGPDLPEDERLACDEPEYPTPTPSLTATLTSSATSSPMPTVPTTTMTPTATSTAEPTLTPEQTPTLSPTATATVQPEAPEETPTPEPTLFDQFIHLPIIFTCRFATVHEYQACGH